MQSFLQFLIIGLGAGAAYALFAQGAVLILIKDVPHPGDRGLALCHPRGEITAHAVSRRLFARNHRKAT